MASLRDIAIIQVRENSQQYIKSNKQRFYQSKHIAERVKRLKECKDDEIFSCKVNKGDIIKNVEKHH